MKVLARLCSAIIAASLLVSLSPSCATQNEGERCDKKNGDADCDTGLVCTPVNIAYDACCWPVGNTNQNTSAACLQNQAGNGGGTGGSPNTADAADGAHDSGADSGAAE